MYNCFPFQQQKDILMTKTIFFQTGLTPLMEAASGGYHEVGHVLITKVVI